MTEETQTVKEKYYEELKWGSYFFIYGFLVTILYSTILTLVLLRFSTYETLTNSFWFMIIVVSVLFLYCTTQCVIEKLKQEQQLRFFARIWIGVKVLAIYYILWAFFSGSQFLVSSSLLMRNDNYVFVCKEEDLLPETKSNLFADFLKLFQRKIV